MSPVNTSNLISILPVSTGMEKVNDFISDNKTALAIGGAGAAGIVVGGIIGSAITARKNSSSKKPRKRKTTKRKVSKKKKSVSRRYKYARTAGKAKDRSTKRIRMTKNGQPYIILKSGKARFIKKSSARASRKRKGGRY